VKTFLFSSPPYRQTGTISIIKWLDNINIRSLISLLLNFVYFMITLFVWVSKSQNGMFVFRLFVVDVDQYIVKRLSFFSLSNSSCRLWSAWDWLSFSFWVWNSDLKRRSSLTSAIISNKKSFQFSNIIIYLKWSKKKSVEEHTLHFMDKDF
jgi:hypothetical protein